MITRHFCFPRLLAGANAAKASISPTKSPFHRARSVRPRLSAPHGIPIAIAVSRPLPVPVAVAHAVPDAALAELAGLASPPPQFAFALAFSLAVALARPQRSVSEPEPHAQPHAESSTESQLEPRSRQQEPQHHARGQEHKGMSRTTSLSPLHR